MYKYFGFIIFLFLLFITGYSIYQAIITGNVIYYIFSIILLIAIILQVKRMIHITITYEEEEDNKEEREKD